MSWFRSPAWDSVVYWALDLETSGLSPSRSDILSVGMVPIREGVIQLGESYYSLVALPDDHVVSQESMKVHHILPAEADDCPPISAVLDEVMPKLTEGALLLHWAKLDLGFLRMAATEDGRDWPKVKVVDTTRLLAKLNRRRQQLYAHNEPYSPELGKARQQLGLPPHTRHHALNDAIATAELFLVLRHRLSAKKLSHLT